jgi:hypothetical protein
MLDAASVVVQAVHGTMPAEMALWLRRNPNPRTSDGQYRCFKRFVTDHGRKGRLCHLFRQFHGSQRPGRTNRQPGEPLHEYMPMELVVLAVRQLLWEIRERRHDFKDPSPKITLRPDQYITWLQNACLHTQQGLGRERDDMLQSEMQKEIGRHAGEGRPVSGILRQGKVTLQTR